MPTMDFSDAESSSFAPIPAATYAKARLEIRWVNYESRIATRTSDKGNKYISVIATITEGKYRGRKIFDLLGVGAKGESTFVDMGRSKIKSILEYNGASANNPNKYLISEDYHELDNIDIAIKIGVQDGIDQHGNPEKKNTIAKYVSPSDKNFDDVRVLLSKDSGEAPAFHNQAPSYTAPPMAPHQNLPGESEIPSWI